MSTFLGCGHRHDSGWKVTVNINDGGEGCKSKNVASS